MQSICAICRRKPVFAFVYLATRKWCLHIRRFPLDFSSLSIDSNLICPENENNICVTYCPQPPDPCPRRYFPMCYCAALLYLLTRCAALFMERLKKRRKWHSLGGGHSHLHSAANAKILLPGPQKSPQKIFLWFVFAYLHSRKQSLFLTWSTFLFFCFADCVCICRLQETRPFSRGNIGQTSDRWDGANLGFPECVEPILNWAELKWTGIYYV